MTNLYYLLQEIQLNLENKLIASVIISHLQISNIFHDIAMLNFKLIDFRTTEH